MKIFVEGGRLSTVQFTGINNVIAQALLAWADISPGDQFIVASHAAFNPEFEQKARLRPNIEFRVDAIPDLVPAGARNAFWFYFLLPGIVNQIKPDLYWASATLVPFGLHKTLHVLTIVYDLVPVLYRETMSLKGRIITALSYQYSIRRARTVWTISRHVRDEMHRHLPESVNKPVAVACAIDHSLYYPRNLSAGEKIDTVRTIIPDFNSGKVLLFVGTVEPRKNLGFLVSLMPQLAAEGFNLIVVGGSGWGKALPDNARAMIADPANRIFFAGRITNKELANLYSAVDLFVSTSLDEGFCMPAVESMACGTPVVLADNSAMSEVVGTGGYLQSGWNRANWIETILRAAYELSRQDALVQAKRYTWPEQLNSLLAVLKGKELTATPGPLVNRSGGSH